MGSVVALRLFLLCLTAGLGACAAARVETGAPARLVLWGFDKVFLASVPSPGVGAPRLEPVRLAVRPPVKDLIDASAAGRKLAVSGRRQESERLSEGWAIFVIDAVTGVVEAQIPHRGRGMGLAPGGQRLAFTLPTPTSRSGLDLVVLELATSRTRVIVPGPSPVGPYVILSWHPSGESVAYDGEDGWIYSARVADSQITRLVEGSAPAWAPDGERLTFRRDDTVYLYETRTGTTRALHTRRPRQSGLNVGLPSWSPDGKYVAWNGEILYDKECLLIDVVTGKVWAVHRSPYWCGPWVELPTSAQ